MFARLLSIGLAVLLGVATAAAQTRPAPAPAASLIDINSASRDDLMSLEGIGEVRADAIIRARPFKAKTELVERRLIPEALYDKIADKVMARPPPGATPTPSTRRESRWRGAGWPITSARRGYWTSHAGGVRGRVAPSPRDLSWPVA